MYSAKAISNFKVYYESATKNDLVIKITQFKESPITVNCEIEVHEKDSYGRGVNSKTRATQVLFLNSLKGFFIPKKICNSALKTHRIHDELKVNF